MDELTPISADKFVVAEDINLVNTYINIVYYSKLQINRRNKYIMIKITVIFKRLHLFLVI